MFWKRCGESAERAGWKQNRRKFPGENSYDVCGVSKGSALHHRWRWQRGGAEHLETCHVCSDLVRDLRYIAEAAKLLVPMEEPSPRVWNNIEREVEREGLAKPARRNM